MARKTTADSVVVLTTHIDHPLIIRANPTDTEVRRFVKEHTRRYISGEPGGPSGISALRIYSAKRYATEQAFLADEDPVAEVKIEDLLPTT